VGWRLSGLWFRLLRLTKISTNRARERKITSWDISKHANTKMRAPSRYQDYPRPHFTKETDRLALQYHSCVPKTCVFFSLPRLHFFHESLRKPQQKYNTYTEVLLQEFQNRETSSLGTRKARFQLPAPLPCPINCAPPKLHDPAKYYPNVFPSTEASFSPPPSTFHLSYILALRSLVLRLVSHKHPKHKTAITPTTSPYCCGTHSVEPRSSTLDNSRRGRKSRTREASHHRPIA